MSMKAMLIICVIVYSVVVIVVVDACHYPDFVQSGSGERDWRGHLLPGPTECSVSFDGRLMRVLSSNVSFQRRCMLKVGNQTYLAAQRDIIVTSDKAPQSRYLCIQFVRRGDAVLQLRTSRLASRMDPHLCAENQLMLDDRPLVDRRHRWLSSVESGSGCQLAGGYDIHLYDRRLRRGVCDALDAETRLEAACGGDNSLIHFRFRYDFCVPSGLGMGVDQMTRCAATWTTDDDVFTVIVASAADNEDYLDAWCLRRPRRTFGRPFIAFLFSQLVCDRRPAAKLADAFMVDMRQSRDWKSLCEDDYEGCEWDYPAKCKRTADCPRTCAVCNDSSPTDCFFGAPLIGRWRSPDGTTFLKVDVSSVTLTVVDKSGRATSTEYDCVEWHRDPTFSDVSQFVDHHVDEHLLVTRPGIGCRPRYACAQLQYHALAGDSQTPSVIHFRISASRPWPIYDRLDCSSFLYVSLQSSINEVDQHFALLTSSLTNSTHGRDYVSCVATSLPVTRRFVVEFEHEHQRCFALIEPSTNPADVDRYFRLILDGCWDKNVALDVRCLDRVTLSGESAVLLVTELSPFVPSSEKDSLLCWLFTDNDTFYLLSPADCDPLASLTRVQSGVIHPFAVFVDALTITSTTTTPSVLIAEKDDITVYGPADDISALYDGTAPDSANNVTSQAIDSATATPTSRRQLVSSVATSIHTRHDSAPQQSSAAVDARNVGSRGHSDRSHAGTSSYVHATNTAAAATTAVIAVDVFILFAPIIPVGICVRSGEL